MERKFFFSCGSFFFSGKNHLVLALGGLLSSHLKNIRAFLFFGLLEIFFVQPKNPWETITFQSKLKVVSNFSPHFFSQREGAPKTGRDPQPPVVSHKVKGLLAEKGRWTDKRAWLTSQNDHPSFFIQTGISIIGDAVPQVATLPNHCSNTNLVFVRVLQLAR